MYPISQTIRERKDDVVLETTISDNGNMVKTTKYRNAWGLISNKTGIVLHAESKRKKLIEFKLYYCFGYYSKGTKIKRVKLAVY
jgi:hypothetical protein